MKPRSLATRFSCVIALLVTLSVGSMGILALVLSRQSVRERVLAANLTAATLTARAIEQYVSDATSIMREAPRRPKLSQEIHSANWPEVSRVLENFARHFIQFDSVFVQDPHGVMRVRVPVAETVGHDYSRQDFFREAIRTREAYISGVYVSDSARRPVVSIAVPVLDERQSVTGVLVGDLSLGALSRFVSAIGQEDGSRIYVVDRNGYLIAHTAGLGGDSLVDVKPEPIVQAVLTGRSGTMEFREPGSAERLLGAHVPVPRLGWGVVATKPATTAFIPVDRLTRWFGWVALACTTAAILVGWRLARMLVGPLRRIADATKRLGTGDIGARTGLPHEGAEVGQLARAFDDMAESLERQKAEADRADIALRESEARKAAMLASALDCVITIDQTGRVLEFNPAAERTFGYQRDEVLGREMATLLMPPALRDRHRDGLARYLATGHGPVIGQRLEMTALRADSTEFPIELTITRLPSDGPPMFTGFLRDITHQKRAQEALRESEASFRLLFSSNPLPMWVYDVGTLSFLEVNDAAVSHYGYSRDEFLTMRITDIRPPEDVPRLTDAVARIAEGMDQAVRRPAGPWRHRLKDGRVRDVDIVSHSIDFSGRRAALVVSIDVTELKQTQHALAKYTERLSVLHEIDRAIIAAESPVAIAEAVIQRFRDLLGVPRAIVNLFDVAAGEAEWLAAAGRRRIHLGPGVRFPLALMGDLAALRRGEPQVIDVTALPPNTHTEALLASGVHVYMVVPMIAGGELIGGLSFGGESREFPPEQVSIAKEAAAQLAIAIAQARLYERVARQAEELEQRVRERTRELSAANEHLEMEIGERRRAEAETDRANRAKSEFLSRMSHELRTPLNGIIGFAQLLELEVQNADQRESVEQILKGGRHLLGLINEVLDIARIEAGKLSISPEPVLAGEVLRAALDLIRPQAAVRSIEVLESPPAEYYVTADRQRLQQVLLNLLSNAVKYNREGGAVRVACEPGPSGRLRLTVSDTGRGIAPQMMKRLFTPFDRLGAEQTAVEGTGLGLALSQRLVDAMGGTLTADSTVGEGTTFTVELQRADGPPAPNEAVLGSEGRDGSRTDVRGTVLYIEDNLSNLRLLERILARRPGVTLLSTMQGRRGLELARDHRPDLIFLDLHLPDVPGTHVLTELLADPTTKALPVVILSADATPGRISRLLEQGARAYLTKPLDVRQLLALIDDTLKTVED